MRFDAPPDDDAPVRPQSIVPPADRTSRAIRIKLLMLFSMLIVVVVLMQEAGKPERWQWMGFKAPESNDLEVDSLEGTQVIPSDNRNGHPVRSLNDSNLPAGEQPHASSRPITIATQRSGSTKSTGRPPASINPGFGTDLTDYPVAAISFWNSTFDDLNPQEQSALLRLLKNLRLGQTLPTSTQLTAQKLIRKISNSRDQYDQSLFDQLALAPDGSPGKTKLAEELFESQDIWAKQILPAFEAVSHGLEFTVGQQQAARKLQHVIDPLLYQQVQDRTSLGWSGDTGAWIRLWEQAIDGDASAGNSVSRIELMGQPDLYRGQTVTVEGWVRSARKKVLDPESELGLPHYFVLWVRPLETKQGPYCVYTMELPAEFPDVTEQFSELNERVQISGYPFKIRTYVTADSSVDQCPVMIASHLTRIDNPEFTSVNQWQPSRLTLMIALISIPLIASFLAWAAFRNSETRPFTPGKTTQKRIDQTLSELSNDPQVQTERESVMRLYEAELHD